MCFVPVGVAAFDAPSLLLIACVVYVKNDSRVASSLLVNADLSLLVAHSAQEFEDLAGGDLY